MNRNDAATLKLGYARGIALPAATPAGVAITEYGAKAGKLRRATGLAWNRKVGAG